MGIARDRVMETATTTGTGDITLAGAVTGFRTFTSAVSLNVLFDYCIEAVDADGVPTGDWEVGEGYLSGTATLVRGVTSSSNADALVSLSAGTKRVFLTVSAAEIQDKGQTLSIANFIAMN
jgi:hypothetical protein